MTKRELIRVLEPFNDNIEIRFHAANNDYDARVFYSFDIIDDSACIRLSVNFPNKEKTTELKVR